MMNYRITFILFFLLSIACQRNNLVARNENLFNDGWQFHRGDIEGAENPSFDDKSWRDIDLPHDWSIENLPGQEPGKVVGPFSIESPGTTATGYTLGGTGWYRKTFTLSPDERYEKTIINFDGVYMNSHVWVNGKLVGRHPYGYTAFHFDITEFLNPAGEPNVIAVQVKNEGENSRWYSGSGIYRHVWLIQKQAVSIAHNGVFINTEGISDNDAEIKISSTLENHTSNNTDVNLLINIIDPGSETSKTVKTEEVTIPPGGGEIIQNITLPMAELWSPEAPNLYNAEIKVVADGKVKDEVSETFGIRTIHFNAKTGLTLNGEPILLKGGNLHHDNGFLGAAAIDRAEERRVELMKQNGFNAIRAAHNPPSKQFLDACDRIGILVMNEAFDNWKRPKKPDDYHLYFEDWWRVDLKSMIYRDRNHPSVILWSIGNEIHEGSGSLEFDTRKKLAAEVRALDTTRPVTEGICGFWDDPDREWPATAPAFAELDVGGYNYKGYKYESDHIEFPDRIIVGTESTPGEIFHYWQNVKNMSWVIGDFVWTAMDYLGETGVAHAGVDVTPGQLQTWPWFNAFCGDIDLCGFKKPQSFYRDVVWNNSKLEMMVHYPYPEDEEVHVSYWGWPDEFKSWNWKGHEGRLMDVRVFTQYPLVKLELNGKIIDRQPAGEKNEYIANFKVPYEPGVLKAIAIEGDVEVASKEIITTGEPAKISLVADRDEINADRNDLSYVTVEITDAQGNLVPNASFPVKFSVSGIGEIAGSGNSLPNDMESFNNPVCQTYRGRALAILRPLENNKVGTITLRAEADGLVDGEINITVQ